MFPLPACRPGASVMARLLPLALLALAAGCKKSSNAPAVAGIRPAEEVRSTLLVTVTAAPLDRIVGHVDAMSRTLGLPFAGKDLLTTLAAQNSISPETVALVDTSRAVGVAYVAPPAQGPGKEQPPLDALAVSARSAADTEKLIAALGAVAESGQGARRIQRPGGTSLWVATQGSSLLASHSREGLAAAGALALEAQKPPASDLLVTFYPDALARSRGGDVRAQIAAFARQLVDEPIEAAARRGGPSPGPAERVAYEAIAQALLDPLADSTQAAFNLDLDPRGGIRFGLRLAPRAGSALTRRLVPAPFAVDPALLASAGADRDSVALLWATGPGSFLLDLWSSALAAQAKAGIRGAAELGQRFSTLRAQLTGASSGVLAIGQSAAVGSATVLPLAPAVSAGTVRDALASFTGAPGFATLLGEVYGRQAPEVRNRQEHDVLRTELAFPVHDRPGDVGTTLKALLGSATITTLAGVGRGRLVLTTGPSGAAASARLTPLLAGSAAAAPPPELARALGEARGADGFAYLDLWATARPGMAAMRDAQAARALGMLSALPGFAQLKLPLVMTYRGGEAWTGELRVPMSTLTSAAAVLRPLIGAGAPAP